MITQQDSPLAGGNHQQMQQIGSAPMDQLAVKIARVMGELNMVPKRGFNQHSKYPYALESDVADAARRAMAHHNLALIPTILGMETTEGKTRSGNTSYMTHVKVGFRLIDGDSGQYCELEIIGSGQDTGEKAIYKAYTGAKKYALLLLFLISTGDEDPEDGVEELESATYGRGDRPAEPDPRRAIPQRRTPQAQDRSQSSSESSPDKPDEKPAEKPEIRPDQVTTIDGAIAPRVTNETLKVLEDARIKADLSEDQFRDEWLTRLYQRDDPKDLSKEQARELMQFMILVPAARLCAEAQSDDDLDTIEGIIRSIRNPMDRPSGWIAKKKQDAMDKVAHRAGNEASPEDEQSSGDDQDPEASIPEDGEQEDEQA